MLKWIKSWFASSVPAPVELPDYFICSGGNFWFVIPLLSSGGVKGYGVIYANTLEEICSTLAKAVNCDVGDITFGDG